MLLLESCFTSEGFNFGYTSRDLLATKHEVEIEIAKFDFGKKLVFEFSHPSRSIRVSLKIVVGSMNVCTAQDLYNLNRIPAYSPIDVECIAYNAQSMDPSEIITLSDPYWDRFLESFLNIPLLVSSIISKLS